MFESLHDDAKTEIEAFSKPNSYIFENAPHMKYDGINKIVRKPEQSFNRRCNWILMDLKRHISAANTVIPYGDLLANLHEFHNRKD